MEADRISGLPDEIIHHILSFLPTKDVPKTSVLSKAFLSSWCSFPVIALDHSTSYLPKLLYSKINIERFTDFLHRSIQRWKLQQTSLLKLELSYPFYSFNEEDCRRFDDAIRFAIRNGVKVLKLETEFCRYSLPLVTDSSNSLKTLKLFGVTLSYFKQLLAASPVIGTLCIDFCTKVFEIDSPSLLELSICRPLNINVGINISSCTSLKVLYFDEIRIKDEWVQKTIPQLVQLRDLKFSRCNALTNLRICSGSLKSVELVLCHHLWCVEIVGNTVECLNFIGSSFCEIKFNAPKLMSLPVNWGPTVSIRTTGPLHDNFFYPLRYSIQGFFESWTHCNIICSSDKDWIIPEKVRRKLVVPVHSLKRLTVKGYQRISIELLDSLLWLFPLARIIKFRSDDNKDQVIRIANTTDTNTRRKTKRMNKHSETHKEDGAVKHDDLSRCFCLYQFSGMCWRHLKYTILLENFESLDRENLMKYFAQKGKVVWWVNKCLHLTFSFRQLELLGLC